MQTGYCVLYYIYNIPLPMILKYKILGSELLPRSTTLEV